MAVLGGWVVKISGAAPPVPATVVGVVQNPNVGYQMDGRRVSLVS